MGSFSVQLAKPAVADLDELRGEARMEVLQDLAKLRDDPLPGGQDKKKLKGFKAPMYRLRSGDYRVPYRIDGSAVTILRVIDRKDLERIVKRLR